jgi:hypothetical protein
MDTVHIVVYVIFGALGMGYFVYGKRQKMLVPLFCGVGLMAYPYFVSNAVLLVVIGAVLLAVPYYFRY